MAVKLNEKVWDAKAVERAGTRDGLGKGLLQLGKTDARVVALTADLAESVRVHEFAKLYPDRYFEVGVSEQNMASVAIGMALEGKIPFLTSFAAFSPGRNWDQIRVGCYCNANFKVASTHAGITVGEDGATHQAMEDVAIARVIPRMTVVVPCDVKEAAKATVALGRMHGPAYIRYGREKTPVVTADDTPFSLGKAETFYDGDDVTLAANGVMVYEALLAAKLLENEGVSARVLNVHTVKPIDRTALVKAARETGAVVCAEEHQVAAGTGSAVAEVLSQEYPVPMRFVGMQDRFGESGPALDLLKHFKFTAENIAAQARDVLRQKK